MVVYPECNQILYSNDAYLYSLNMKTCAIQNNFPFCTSKQELWSKETGCTERRKNDQDVQMNRNVNILCEWLFFVSFLAIFSSTYKKKSS